ncbi:SAG-related sequence [Besnoitia besnoiti]|uniref:SAG-related sequence n=1 Tax=Besnoitia besnoiti TaxID=94643 RepID=A0A2A9MM12_BESBE|nr:SAG-related sequence [Besnoitia besnoiti]PFH36550.1 SAG-related sequence [Besnoitia besnoiti]
MQSLSSQTRIPARRGSPMLTACAVELPFSKALFSCSSLLHLLVLAGVFVHVQRARAEEPIPVCEPAGNAVALHLTNEKLNKVQFKCGENLTTLLPEKKPATHQTHFCQDPKCTVQVPLGGLAFSEDPLVSVAAPAAAQQTTYTVSVEKLPDTPYTAYFVCSAQSKSPERSMRSPVAADSSPALCVVQVSVWASKPTTVPSPNVCDGTSSKKLSLKVGEDVEPVTFACGEKRELSPALFDDVFQTATEGQEMTAKLQSLIPQAKLIANGFDGSAHQVPAYTLTVPELPETGPVQLLYKCAATKKSGKNRTRPEEEGLDSSETAAECEVMVEVAKRPPSPGSDDETSEQRRTNLVAVSSVAFLLAPYIVVIA